jgi:isopenicillin N synthase-like dioxygenase
MGESLQILSGGLLNATPHYVQGARPSVKEAHGVSRNTLAVFMQPHWDDKLCVPEGMPAEGVKPVVAWEEGQTFGEFTNVKLGQYYLELDAVAAK